jgi:hypothetical protein
MDDSPAEEFTCLATKLDEYIKRVNDKYFIEVF